LLPSAGKVVAHLEEATISYICALKRNPMLVRSMLIAQTIKQLSNRKPFFTRSKYS